jgi:hypothetical protein
MISQVFRLTPIPYSLSINAIDRGKALTLNIFRYYAGFEKLAQIIDTTSFRTDTGEFEAAEGLARNDRACNPAIDIEIAYFKFGLHSIDMRGRAGV